MRPLPQSLFSVALKSGTAMGFRFRKRSWFRRNQLIEPHRERNELTNERLSPCLRCFGLDCRIL
jgi:hypothetical protein